jgi:hypothetical protein
VLALDCVAPSGEAAQDGSYTPLARPLFIYPSGPALSGKPQAAGFVEYYVANARKIAEEAMFIPLNAEQESELKADLRHLTSGGAWPPETSPEARLAAFLFAQRFLEYAGRGRGRAGRVCVEPGMAWNMADLGSVIPR